MRRNVILLLIGLCLLSLNVNAQKRAPKKAPAATAAPSGVPVMPIEAKIGLYRREGAVFLTIRNDSKDKTIKSVFAFVVTFDQVRMQQMRNCIETFKFAIPVPPKEKGQSVITQSEVTSPVRFMEPSSCSQYEAIKDKPGSFVPHACAPDGDIIKIGIIGITYTDGTVWGAPLKEDEKK